MIYLIVLFLVPIVFFATLAFLEVDKLSYKYIRYLPIFMFIALIKYPLSFVAVAFEKGLQLQTPFKWLDTIDNDLTGDDGWKKEHLIGSDPKSYINKVRWIWRNGGNRFNYYVIGVADTDKSPEYFWSKTRVYVTSKWFLDLRVGWGGDDSKEGRRKYVATCRFKTKP